MAAPLMKCREATKAGADGVVPKENLATTCFGTTPPARPFVELDGLAGTPPNLGGEFKRSPANSFTPSSIDGRGSPAARGRPQGEELRLALRTDRPRRSPTRMGDADGPEREDRRAGFTAESRFFWIRIQIFLETPASWTC